MNGINVAQPTMTKVEIANEFAQPEWQNVFHIKCQKLFTFENGYLLLF